jgi:hypothetical protein
VPFQVIETERALTVRFYSAMGDVDWIRYGRDTLIHRLGWSQSGTDELSFTAELTQPVWGVLLPSHPVIRCGTAASRSTRDTRLLAPPVQPAYGRRMPTWAWLCGFEHCCGRPEPM